MKLKVFGCSGRSQKDSLFEPTQADLNNKRPQTHEIGVGVGLADHVRPQLLVPHPVGIDQRAGPPDVPAAKEVAPEREYHRGGGGAEEVVAEEEGEVGPVVDEIHEAARDQPHHPEEQDALEHAPLVPHDDGGHDGVLRHHQHPRRGLVHLAGSKDYENSTR